MKSSHLEHDWTPDGLDPNLAIERMREMLDRVLEMFENFAIWINSGLRTALARKIDALR